MFRDGLQRRTKWIRDFILSCKTPVWLLALCPAVLWHCAQSPALDKRVDQFINQQWQSIPVPEPGAVSLLFEEALALAVQYNGPIQQALGESKLGSIDVAQAKSELWPRFDIQASGQIPLGDDSDSYDNNIRGGLFVRYDFHKALFRSDAVAAARVTKLKKYEEASGLMVDLAYALYDQLVQVELLRKEVGLRKVMVDQAQKGALTALRMFRLRMIDQPLTWQWESTAQTQQRLHRKAQAALEKAQRTLGFLLGGGIDPAKLTVTDFKAMTRKLETAEPQDFKSVDFLRELWKRRTDCRIAEMDLFLAEMAILNAKRKRVPRLTGSLGVGSFNVWSDDDEEVPAAFELSVHMPLLDWGDISRQVDKAKHRRTWAQRKIHQLVRRLQYDIEESQTDLDTASDLKKQAQTTWQALDSQAKMNDRLLKSNLIQPLDAKRLNLEAGDAKIAYHQSVVSERRARATLNKLLGFSLIDFQLPDLKADPRTKGALPSGEVNEP